MHRDVIRFARELKESTDERYCRLDTPSHGKLPKWLADMSNSAPTKNSVPSPRSYFQSKEANNNDRYNTFSTHMPRAHHSLGATPEGSTPSSGKYGRRSLERQSRFTNSQENMPLASESNIVPNMEQLNLNNYPAQSQIKYDHEKGYMPLYRQDRSYILNADNPGQLSLSGLESQPKSYSPSLLNQSAGRRSRIEQIQKQISRVNLSLNDSVSSMASSSSSHIANNSKPILQQPYILKSLEEQLPCNRDQFASILLSDPSAERRLRFEEEFTMIRNKSQHRSKRNKSYRKKYKNQNSGDLKHRETRIDNPIRDNNRNSAREEEEDLFIIPELPSGMIMIVDILSTWGDKYYVGLNGIETFDSDGNLAKVRKITASPEDINVLPECSGDPRVVTNILDGVNRTQDDNHLWLTPFETGGHHLITIEFYQRTELAMIRIWNYNKSRIHSFRGAKDVVITLDGVCIFRGEIAQACGSIMGGIESFGDTILFTTEEPILQKISCNDLSFTTIISESDAKHSDVVERPSTGTDHRLEETTSYLHERPYTHANNSRQNEAEESESGEQLFGAHRLDLVLILNWGKSDYIGLTGLEIIGDSEIPIPITKDNLRSNKISSSAMIGRLIDNERITNDRKHMWYTQYISGEEIVISIFFESIIYISGIRIWNYNENLEMTFCGARMIKILLDGKPMVNPLSNDSTFLIRRAPGNAHYDFVQEIRFSEDSSLNLMGLEQEPSYDLHSFTSHKEDLFENPLMPEGFVFQIVIYTTWGDQYYVGLNGLEFFDQNGKRIVLTDANVCAHPESVNVLPGVSGDIRTPDKLVDGINDQSDGTHSWLAPVIPKCLNRIYIVFDQPVTISVMKIWNYLKTPTRGVKEFGILVDDLLLYNGILDKIHDKSSVKYRTILFTNNKNVLQKEMASLVKHSIDSQATVLTNSEPRVTTGGSLPNADQSLRPFTSVNYINRGQTSQSH